ncbi:MAG: hypothetical protein M0Z95_23200 [Actinomycetota bacterium]|nr:hypothetical protein [Actinomycetota bacterium]
MTGEPAARRRVFELQFHLGPPALKAFSRVGRADWVNGLAMWANRGGD